MQTIEALSLKSVPARLRRARGAVKNVLTPALVRAKLTAMAAMFNLRPSLRHHLEGVHPLGVPWRFEATMEFVTLDGAVAAHVVFGGGKMLVRSGAAERADTTVRFRGPEEVRRFFSGADPFNMLLDNTMQFDGNLSVLVKFAHMSAALLLGETPVPRRPGGPTEAWPRRWQDLPVPKVGLPALRGPQSEATFLDDLHLADVTLDQLPRVRRLLWAARTTRPAVCTERPRLLTDFVLQQRLDGVTAEEPVLRQARALRHILTHRRPLIREDDLLAGTTTSQRIGIVIFPELGGVGLWPELLTLPGRELNPYDISAEDVAVLDRQVFPFWMNENVREWTKAHAADRTPYELDERFVLYFLWKTQAASHTVVDVPRALDRGLLSLQVEASEREQRTIDPVARAFYQALRVALDGVLTYATHLAEQAERQLVTGAFAGPDGAARRQVLEDLARICRKVPASPPETLQEAVQAIWLLFVCQHQENMGAGLVVGRLDAWLQPYLERDLAGVKDPAERRRVLDRALELICALMLKLTDHLPMVPDLGNRLFGGSSENQVITLGGVKKDGTSAVCDMTWLFLKATELLRVKDPNVNARYAPGVNSEAYLARCCELNLLTHATPSLHNDDAIIPALQRQGFALEDARDWTATGCVEPTSCGRHFGHTNCMLVNLVAPLEMALRNGVHPLLGRRVGPATGALEAFQSYEAFAEAYATQLRWLLGTAVEANNGLGRAHQLLKPSPLLSALFDGPMTSGKDVTAGGAKYNTSGVALIGLTDVIDSLCAVKTLVFERRLVTLTAFKDALDADFVGHDVVRQSALKRVPKFGQDDALPTAIARDVQRLAFDCLQALPHYRGGRYLPGYWSMSNHVAFGLLSGALPSGRKKGEPFTPGLTPSQHAGASLTDQLRAVAGLEAELMPNNIAFNVKVVPGAGDEPAKVVERMSAYAGAFFELGGMQMQFNVTSSQTLRDAMARPQDYGDLLVRISGYNAYFVELNRDIQLELIGRAEHRLDA